MLFGFVDYNTLYLIAHVFGAILGAGGAFMSDIMFLNSVKDGVIDRHELRFMKIASRVVWFGIGLLVLSGIFLVSANPEFYLSSHKFLVKFTVVIIIILNGIIFHTIHLPHMKKHSEIKFAEVESFRKKASFLMISGAVSMVSWISTVILGMLRNVPFSYFEIFSVYLVFLLVGISGALFMKNKILGFKN